MDVEQFVEWELAGETEVLVKDTPLGYFVTHTWPGIELGVLLTESKVMPIALYVSEIREGYTDSKVMPIGL
jgi:hypothetical protein